MRSGYAFAGWVLAVCTASLAEPNQSFGDGRRDASATAAPIRDMRDSLRLVQLAQAASSLLTRPMTDDFAFSRARRGDVFFSGALLNRSFIQREADPERGAANLNRDPETTGIPPLVQANLNAHAEQQRQQACGEVVKALRAPLTAANPQNRIRNFNSVCLLLGPNHAISPLASVADRTRVQSCADLHVNYLKHCLPPMLSEGQTARVHAQAGIVILDPNPNDAEAEPEIICSGVVVGRTSVLIARHCLGKLNVSNGPRPALRFLPTATRAALTNAASPARSGVEMISVLSPNSFAGRSIASLAAEQTFSRENDMVIVKTASDPLMGAFPADSGLRPGSAGRFSRVAIGGFQLLAYRAMLLRARLDGKPLADFGDLIASGDWVRLFQIDATPTCRLQEPTAEERTKLGTTSARILGHFCQTQERASGAALIALSDNPGDTSMTLAGVHVGGHLEPEESAATPIETLGSANYAVLFDAEFKAAIATAP